MPCTCKGCETQKLYDQARMELSQCGNTDCPCMAPETKVEESPVLEPVYQLTIAGPIGLQDNGLEFTTRVDVIDTVNILWQYFGINVSPTTLEQD